MNELRPAVQRLVDLQRQSEKPLAIILAGHNGSGKSTLWEQQLAPVLQIPLVNADRLMMSILPVPSKRSNRLPAWAQELRDTNEGWMKVAQEGVQAFVAKALSKKVPFAFETVFSHWKEREDGTVESKISQILEMQAAGYYVVLIFVGLTSAELSIARVETRLHKGGHSVPIDKLLERFPRTQRAINQALDVADAAILLDNSRDVEYAFTVCHVRAGGEVLFDWREVKADPPPEQVMAWMRVVVH